MTTMKEHRLIYRTMTAAERKAYEDSQNKKPAVVQVDRRTTTDLSNRGYSTVNPNAKTIEDAVKTNFDASKATPAEIQKQNNAMAAAKATGASTNDITLASRQVAGAPLQSTLSGASGQAGALGDTTESAVAPGGIEQSALDRLGDDTYDGTGEKRATMTGDAAAAQIESQKSSIQKTMSNTGMTIAQAQHLLATSRNPNDRAAAQATIDESVNNVKGYDQIPIKDKQGNITGYKNVENSAKTAENQQRERERLAQEEANRLASQQAADEHKKFVAGIDTSALDQTKTQIETMLSQISGLSPDLQAAVLPGLISLQNSNSEVTKAAQEILDAQPTDAEIEAQYGTMDEYIKSEDLKYKALLERNLETAKEVATYNRDALELDKKLADHDAAVAEQNQLAMNVEGEKKLRRQLNRLGIQTDISGLNYLQSEIQKGADALANLKKGDNLVSLRAQLAIGEGYRLDVKQALEGYESKYLEITSLTTEKLQGIKNSISTAKSERNKEIKEVKKWELEQKGTNDKEARGLIYDAHTKMMEAAAEAEKTRQAEAKVELAYQRQQQDQDERDDLAYARELRVADRTADRADLAQRNYEKNNERADRKAVKTQFDKVSQSQTVKDYATLRNTQSKVADLVSDARANPDDTGKVGAAITLGMTLTAKGSDPTTGVRDSELTKFGWAQSLIDKVWAAKKAFDGGDTTGITIDIVEKYSEAMTLLSETQRQEAQAEYIGAINALVDFNNGSQYENLNPATISLPSGISIPDWAASSYYVDEESAESDTSYDVDWEDPSSWESNTGTGQEMPDSPYHVGIDAEAIDIDGRIGDPLRSPATGEVVNVVRGDTGLGNYVVVQKKVGNDVYEYTLGHMDDIRVRIGDTINSGIALGTIGNTGNVIPGEHGDGSHVHYRVTKNGKAYNPRKKTIAST